MRRTARIAVLALSSLLPALLAAAPKAPPHKVPLHRAQGVQSQRPFPNPAVVIGTHSSEDTLGLGTARLPSAAGGMGIARSLFTATLLQNGKVLAVGGANGAQVLSSCEIYDPVTETWSPTASQSGPRNKHTATLLKSGKVLVAGGDDGGLSFLKSSEIYDPGTGTWTPTENNLSEARVMHTATLLPDGRVLVTGGYGDEGLLKSSEMFNPVSNTWASATEMDTGRAGHTATLLGGPNPSVLVVGGEGEIGPNLSSAESYDPNLDEWTPAASLLGGEGRANHTATLLPGGKVLVAGGFQRCTDPECTESSYLNTAQVYDPADDSWTTVGDMADGRKKHTATLLPNGTVLVAGGEEVSGDALLSAALFDAESGAWTEEGLDAARFNHVAVVLPSGGVLLVGGEVAAGPLSSASLYAPAPGSYNGGQPELATVTTSVCLGATQVIATGTNFQGLSEGSGGNGGQNSSTNYPLLQIYSLEDGTDTYLLSDPAYGWSDTTFRSIVVASGAILVGAAEARIVANGIASDPRGMTIGEVPAAPTEVSATAGCTGNSITWTDAATATSHNVLRGSDCGSPATTFADVTSPYDDTTAVAGTPYSYWVVAVNGCGTSPNSLCATGTRIGVPATPAVPSYSAITKTDLTVGWTPVSGATSYDIWRVTGATCIGAAKITASPVEGTFYSDTGLTCGTQYSYFVTANSTCGTSSDGTCAAVTTVVCPPVETAPGTGGISTAQQWTDKTTQSWLANAAATSYTLYRGIQADLPQLLNGSVDSCTKYAGTATSADTINEDPTGLAGGFYWYLVTGSNAGGEGSPGNATAGERIVNSSGACP